MGINITEHNTIPMTNVTCEHVTNITKSLFGNLKSTANTADDFLDPGTAVAGTDNTIVEVSVSSGANSVVHTGGTTSVVVRKFNS